MTKPNKLVRALARSNQIANNIATSVVTNALNDAVGRAYHESKTANTYHANMWKEVGYPTEVSFTNLYNMFSRNGFAYAGVMMPVDYGWAEYPVISDSDDADDKSDWDSQTQKLFKKFKLFKRIKGADWRNRIGEYSAFIVQVQSDDNDQRTWSKPLENITTENIVRFIPVNQDQLKPSSYYPVTDINYPNPSSYNFNEHNSNDKTEAGTSKIDRSFTVHASRVIIFAEGADDDTIHGRPSNLQGFNALLNLEKINASGAEGFWQAVKDNYIARLQNTQKALSPDEKNDITKRFDELSEGLHKAAVVGNWDVDRINKPLPSNYKDVLMNALWEYCASVQIPVAVLIGQITGVLAGDKDNMQFNEMINSRRNHWQSEMIELTLKWLSDTCTDYNEPEEVFITWPNANESSMADKVEIFDKLASAVEKLIKSMAIAGGELPIEINELREMIGLDPIDELEVDSTNDRDKNNQNIGDE